MQFRSGFFAKLVALAVAGSAACSPSTTLEQTWTTPVARSQQPPLRNVVTVFSADNETVRRSGEDQLARELAARGVRATPSYAVLSSTENLLDNPAVKQKLLAMGYDGLVVVNVVERYQELEYAPGGFGYGYGYGYGGYYGAYPYTETVVRVETRAYSLRTNQLVWSGLTRSVGDEPRQVIDETSRVISSQLTKRGLAG